MSVLDVTSRIGQIQSQLAMLAPTAGTATTSGGTDFAAALKGSTTATSDLTAAAPGPSTSDGDAVVADARQYLGVPYVWGGTDPKTGLDCSGLVQHVYKDLGYDLPRVSWQQATAGRPVANLEQAQPGDILAFGSPVHHVGIYMGGNQMIEAPRPGVDVRIGPVYEMPTAIRRIVPDASAAVDPLGAPLAAGRTAPGGTAPAGTPYASLFDAAAQKYGLSSGLLAAVAKQESGFNASAVSPAGAQGLMQLMPGTAAGLGVSNPFDPSQAVDGAAKLLSGLMTRFGRTDLALAAYNAGPGAVLRYGGIPPYPETQNYVRSVLAMAGTS